MKAILFLSLVVTVVAVNPLSSRQGIPRCIRQSRKQIQSYYRKDYWNRAEKVDEYIRKLLWQQDPAPLQLDLRLSHINAQLR